MHLKLFIIIHCDYYFLRDDKSTSTTKILHKSKTYATQQKLKKTRFCETGVVLEEDDLLGMLVEMGFIVSEVLEVFDVEITLTLSCA